MTGLRRRLIDPQRWMAAVLWAKVLRRKGPACSAKRLRYAASFQEVVGLLKKSNYTIAKCYQERTQPPGIYLQIYGEQFGPDFI